MRFLQQHSAVFSEEGGLWRLREGVSPPPRRDALRCAVEDYSVHDTPPGQKVWTSFFYCCFITLYNIEVNLKKKSGRI